jgi:ABC-2 type transport system ATP-binding protein
VTQPVIETDGLRKRFGPKLAVENLSLTVGPGEVFGFLGPNGAGKTTSIKLLLGLIEPSGGSGRLLGAPIGRRAPRAKVGFLPEHFRFHDCLTGRELLRVHGRLYGVQKRALPARIATLLERVDMVDAADRQLRTYSKGMLQRIGLAQALLNEPALVFLDEPTSGLDPLGRRLVREIIEELRDGGTTVFLNSHLLGEVEATCDRVVFVKRGRVVHELSLADEQAGAALEVEIRLAAGNATIAEGLARFGTRIRQDGERLRLLVAGEEILPEIARWLVAEGAALYELRCRRKTLEEWFVEVMGADQRPG